MNTRIFFFNNYKNLNRNQNPQIKMFKNRNHEEKKFKNRTDNIISVPNFQVVTIVIVVFHLKY